MCGEVPVSTIIRGLGANLALHKTARKIFAFKDIGLHISFQCTRISEIGRRNVLHLNIVYRFLQSYSD